MEAAKDERLLIGQGGVSGHVIRLGPSLLITEEEIREGLERFGRSCQTVEDAR
jgi:4-aminobutyrate aminotransferase-like enzyme